MEYGTGLYGFSGKALYIQGNGILCLKAPAAEAVTVCAAHVSLAGHSLNRELEQQQQQVEGWTYWGQLTILTLAQGIGF